MLSPTDTMILKKGEPAIAVCFIKAFLIVIQIRWET